MRLFKKEETVPQELFEKHISCYAKATNTLLRKYKNKLDDTTKLKCFYCKCKENDNLSCKFEIIYKKVNQEYTTIFLHSEHNHPIMNHSEFENLQISNTPTNEKLMDKILEFLNNKLFQEAFEEIMRKK